MNTISVNALASVLVEDLVRDAACLRLNVTSMDNGTTLIDAGVNCTGGIDAGIRITEICMSGLGRAQIIANTQFSNWPWSIQINTSQPVIACMASQYAGWQVSVDVDGKAYTAMASGPGRALVGKEILFKDIAYTDQHTCATLVLESDKLPPVELAEKIATACNIDVDKLTLIVTPTGSLAGCTQIAGRVVEVALHKAHELGFALENIIDAQGITPLPPPSSDMLCAMGRTNDTILFGGQVHLYVDANDADAQALAEALPSSCSRDYGKPFAQVFKEYEFDFFKIDGRLFSPAVIAVTAIESGATFRAGSLAPELIERSFVTPDP